MRVRQRKEEEGQARPAPALLDKVYVEDVGLARKVGRRGGVLDVGLGEGVVRRGARLGGDGREEGAEDEDRGEEGQRECLDSGGEVGGVLGGEGRLHRGGR